MIHIPALRFGKEYRSLETATLVHHITGEPVAETSLVTGSMIARDLTGVAAAKKELAAIPIQDILAMYKKAADYFLHAALPCGDTELTFDDYVRNLSATTGSPQVFCRRNALKVHYVLQNVEEVLAGLCVGCVWGLFDHGYSRKSGRMEAYHPTTDVFAAVLPSNSPGVHALWVPTIAMKTPLLLKPGREEPWTPNRVVAALLKAGLPPRTLAFLPTDHAGSSDILRLCGRSMAFGDDRTMAQYKNDERIEIHGTGYSKILLGEDLVDRWEEYLDVMLESIAGNGGRACVNASGVWAPRHGRAIAEALAAKLARVVPRPWDDPACEIAAFANPDFAESIDKVLTEGLKTPGAIDVTEKIRGTPRLVKEGRCAWLLPTIIFQPHPNTPNTNKEFLFPYAAVLECPQEEMTRRIGYTLAATLITEDPSLISEAMSRPNIDRLNIGPVPTNRLTWNQPHEGNLFDRLYKRRALQFAGDQAV